MSIKINSPALFETTYNSDLSIFSHKFIFQGVTSGKKEVFLPGKEVVALLGKKELVI